MIYFDSDVFVHYFVAYKPVQHAESKEYVEKSMLNGLFYVLQLSMQELAHTMGKFNQPAPQSNVMIATRMVFVFLLYELLR